MLLLLPLDFKYNGKNINKQSPELCSYGLYLPSEIPGEMPVTEDGSCFPLAGSWGYGLPHTFEETDDSGKQELEEENKSQIRGLALSKSKIINA